MDNCSVLDTYLGKIIICGNESGIIHVGFYKGEKITSVPSALTEQAAQQLREYFQGKRKYFDLPLAPKGTDFQKKVWEALLTIPYGETRTYKDIAVQAGNPNACRAVGMANNRNPIMIIIPCHRVIGRDGSLTGYAAGISIKETLLKSERNCQNFEGFLED